MRAIPFSLLPRLLGARILAIETSFFRPFGIAPALQLIPIPIGNAAMLNRPHPTRRYMSINPYTGLDNRKEEREIQRKLCDKGLKVEWADHSTTIMDRARSRLQTSATKRRRTTGTNIASRKCRAK